MRAALERVPAGAAASASGPSAAGSADGAVTVAVVSREPVFPAALVAVAALAVDAAALGMAARQGLSAGEAVHGALAALWALAGLALLARRSLHRLGWLASGAALACAGAYAADAAAGAWTGGGLTEAEGARCLLGALVPAAGFHALLGLPDGRMAGSGARGAVAAAYALAAAVGIAAWAGAGQLSGWTRLGLWTLAVAAAFPATHRRYLATTGTERQRLQWLGCGVVVAALLAVAVGALRLLIAWPRPPLPVALAAGAVIPLAVMASTAPRLAGRIDRVLVHAVSMAGLSLVITGVYVVVVLGLGRAPTSDERQILGLSMAAAVVSALLYRPARERLSDAANRLVYGERYAPDEVLRSFGSRLTRAIPMDELLLQLVESLRKTMALVAAEVWTGTGERLERTASVPDAGSGSLLIGPAERPVVARAGVSGAAWVSVWIPALYEEHGARSLRVAPVTHSGELLGLIVVARAADGDAFTEEDDGVLTELARQVGLALNNVALDSALQETLDALRRQAEELRASRARIVATADAERRRIERNLHDGAQQHLVAMAVNLRLARDLLADDPGGASEMLEQLTVDVRDTISELRDLAHGIYPPLLMDSGLSEALPAAAGRSPLDVSVLVTGAGRYPPEVEAAVYFCCLEALQNAAKHAPGATVELRVWEEEAGLRFEVADDGPGFDATAVAASGGQGFVNMSDRLGAMGGTARWESTPGAGTRVTGSIPVLREPAAQ